MKMNKLIIVTILMLFTCAMFGQNNDTTQHENFYLKNRLNFKISYERAQSTYNYFRFESNYGVFNFLETGIYFGLSKQFFLDQSLLMYSVKSAIVPNYGINLNFHVLPFFIKKQDFRLDIYLTTRSGWAYYDINSTDSFFKKNYFEYEFGGGIVFYPMKHIGAFVEYSPITNLYPNVSNLRIGLSFKFKR